MSLTSPNMNLIEWNLLNDGFSHVQLQNNFALIDQHDHSPSKGVQINTAGIANNAITSAKVSANAITISQLASNSVGSAQIVAGAVGGTQLATASVGNSQIVGGTNSILRSEGVFVTSQGVVAGTYTSMAGNTTATLPSPTLWSICGVRAAASVVGSAPVTVAHPGGGLILGPGLGYGQASILLGTADAFVILVCDGTNWIIAGGQQDTGWISITAFQNSWSAVGGFPPAYRLMGSVVKFTGSITGGSTSTTATTLPSGYRPYNAGHGVLISIGQTVISGYATVSTGGNVQMFFSAGTTFFLDGITYLVD